MKVRLDLRPPEYVERERRRHALTPARFLAFLLLALFTLTCAHSLALHLFRGRGLMGAIRDRKRDIAALEARQDEMMTRLSRLRHREEDCTQRLEILRDLPTIEVLNALEACMNPGTRLKSVHFLPSEALVGAVVPAGELILPLTEGLSQSGLFSDVTVTGYQGLPEQVEFTLALSYAPSARKPSPR